MKRSIIVPVGACLTALGLIAAVDRPAVAQNTAGPFADVPADHWAYRAVDTLLKDGILIGYPDGVYGGKRVMTRYEFAVAVARLDPALDPNICGCGNYAQPSDLADVRRDLENKLTADPAALDALRRLVDEFTPELQKLGQNVAAAKARLDDLEARMAAVEEEQRRVHVDGALNVTAEGVEVARGPAFVDGNGVTIAGDKRLLKTAGVYQDFVLDVSGRVGDKQAANLKLDSGNYLSALGNTAASGYSAGGAAPVAFVPGRLTTAGRQTTVWEADIVSSARFGRAGGGDITVGRFGNQSTAYTLKQVDADVYADLPQTDGGDIATDGVKLDISRNRVGVLAWAGQTKAIPFSQPWAGPAAGSGTQVGARPAGLIPQNHAAALIQGDGLRATYGHSDTGRIGVTLERFATAGSLVDPNSTQKYTLLDVCGIDYTGFIPAIKPEVELIASYTESVPTSGSSAFTDIGNHYRYAALDAQIGRTFGALHVRGGYRYIGPEFTAPGDWGRVSTWIDPTNIEGGVASARVDLDNSLLVLNADVESYRAAYGGLQHGGVINSPLQQGDKLTHFKLGLDYTGIPGFDMLASYEQSTYDLKDNARFPGFSPGKPTDSFFTVGIRHPMSRNAEVRLLYQYDDYKDKGTGFAGVDSGGNVLSTQVTAMF